MRETTYTVEVKTGSKGTNADIEILLFGTKGTWTEFRLMDNPDRDDFEPKRTDVFTFIDDNDIGNVTDVAIRPRGDGLYHDNWKMDGIKIKSDAPGSKETTFKERKRLFKGGKDPIMLRSIDFPVSGTAKKFDPVVVGKYIIAENNFGGPAVSDRTVSLEVIHKENLKITNEDSTSIKQSYEFKTSANLEGIMNIASTFSGEIAATFKKTVAKERETIKKETTSYKYHGEDYHCNFFVFTDYEIQVVGTYDNKLAGSDLKIHEVIAKYKTIEVHSFMAVDQNLGDKSFKQFWEESTKPNNEMPTSPTMESINLKKQKKE